MTKDVNSMQDFQSGQRVKPSDLNAMLHACRATGLIGEGFSEDGGTSLRQKVGAYPDYYEFEGSMALGDIEPYSVFSVKAPSTHVSYPHRVDIAKVGASYAGSGLILLTNRDIKIPAGCKGIAWPVAELPFKVRVTGSTPTVGSPCGVEPGTYGVSSARSGLVCVSASFVESSITYVLVVAHNENVRFLGKASGTIAAASDAASYTTGSVKVVCLEGGIEVDATDPATGASPWLVTVRNYSTTAYASGDRVRFGAYHGCGFVLDKPVAGGSDRCVVVGDTEPTGAYYANSTGVYSWVPLTPVDMTLAGPSDSRGVWVIPFFKGVTANATETVFTINSTPTDYNSPAILLNGHSRYRVTIHTVWQMQYMSDSDGLTEKLIQGMPYHYHTYQDDNYIPAGSSYTYRQTNTQTYTPTEPSVGYYAYRYRDSHLAVRTALYEESKDPITMGISSLPCWVQYSNTQPMIACHSGVAIIDAVGASPYPRKLRIRVHRYNDMVQATGLARVKQVQVTVEQCTNS